MRFLTNLTPFKGIEYAVENANVIAGRDIRYVPRRASPPLFEYPYPSPVGEDVDDCGGSLWVYFSPEIDLSEWWMVFRSHYPEGYMG